MRAWSGLLQNSYITIRTWLLRLGSNITLLLLLLYYHFHLLLMNGQRLFIKCLAWVKHSLVRHKFKGYDITCNWPIKRKKWKQWKLCHKSFVSISVHTESTIICSACTLSQMKWPLLHHATDSEEELPPSVPPETGRLTASHLTVSQFWVQSLELARNLFVWSLHFLPVYAWVFSWCMPGFFPVSSHRHACI